MNRILVAVLLAAAPAFAQSINAEVTFETCGGGTAAVIKGEACHVQDLAKKEAFWEVTMKFGVFGAFGAATGPAVGAESSAAFVVKVKIPVGRAKTQDAARELLTKSAQEVAQAIARAANAQQKAIKVTSIEALLRGNSCKTTEADLMELLQKNACSLSN